METKIIVKGVNIWLYIEPLRVNTKNGLQEIEDECLCYFNLNKPTIEIFGELLKNENKTPIVFASTNKAISYATEYLNNRYK